MRIHIMDLQPGDRLIEDTFNSYGLHVLSADTVLNGECISKLFRHNIDYVDVADRTPVTKTNDYAAASKVQPVFDTSVTGVRELYKQAMSEGRIDPGIVEDCFMPLAESVRFETDLVSLMLSLESRDDYTYQHSVQVGMLSYSIAKWMGSSEESALLAGKAGFLHDIGMSRIDPAILGKPTKLTPQEYTLIQTHTTVGYDMLKQSFGEQSPIALAALQHHERFNSEGYPQGIGEKEIHPVAKIIAIADIYSAMISSRVYQKERDMLYVLKELHRCSFGEIDPSITQVFIRHMIPNFIGKSVVLNTSETGIIVYTNPTDYFRPMIRKNDEFIDLAQRCDLSVEKILA